LGELKSLHTQTVANSLEEIDFRKSLENLIDAWSKRVVVKYQNLHPMRIELECPENIHVQSRVHIALVRIVSQALSNAIFHSGIIENPDTYIKIIVIETLDGLICNVIDNGIGINVIKEGLGIYKMRDIIRELNSLSGIDANIEINSDIKRGTQVQVQIEFS